MKRSMFIFLISLFLFGCGDKDYTKWESLGYANGLCKNNGTSTFEIIKRVNRKNNRPQYKNILVSNNALIIGKLIEQSDFVSEYQRSVDKNRKYKIKKVALKKGNKTEVKI